MCQIADVVAHKPFKLGTRSIRVFGITVVAELVNADNREHGTSEVFRLGESPKR